MSESLEQFAQTQYGDSQQLSGNGSGLPYLLNSA